ncbi:hypothetical protein TrVFT333_004842 [Trichoderma virens FT-333]|nr:hypothetical protein TrVFT333_004842 [Trichoderma virens FT-333]
MKPYEIFTIREYDMVVAVTFDAINRDLRKLAEANNKFHTLIIEMTFDDEGDQVGKLHDTWDTVPTNPPTACNESGWAVQLGVEFTSGSVWFRDVLSGNMRPAQNLAGWKWSILIKVGFAEIRNEKRELIPDVVKNQLEHFTSQGFLISSIFCDLQNIDLLGTGPTVATTDPKVTIKGPYKIMFSTLLMNWIEHVKQNAAINPYILGYVRSYPTSSDPDTNVPDSLKPVGNTFNVFFDSAEQPRSTLNFIINTKNSSIRPDICDGKMSFSFRSFVETLVLRTFYDTYAAGIHEQISSGGIDLGAFKTYDEAKTPTDTGYHFDVYDAQGDPLNQCKTNFDVSFSKSSQGISIDIAGYLYWYKEKKKHVTVAGKSEVARAWAGGEMSWKATIPITLQDGDSDTPKFEVAKPILVSTPIRTWHDQNGVSKSLGQIEHLIGDLIKLKVFP